MSPRDLVYVGHMLDMAKKAISKTQSRADVAPSSIVRERLSASRLPSAALRRFAVLTRPARSREPGNCRSDGLS